MSGGLAFARRCGARLVLQDNTADLVDLTITPIEFTDECVEFDTHGFFDEDDPDRLTVPTGLGGIYLAVGGVVIESDATPTLGRAVFLQHFNSADVSQTSGLGWSNVNQPSGVDAQASCMAIVRLADGDYVRLAAIVSENTTLAVLGDPRTFLSLIRLTD